MLGYLDRLSYILWTPKKRPKFETMYGPDYCIHHDIPAMCSLRRIGPRATLDLCTAHSLHGPKKRNLEHL